MNKEQDIQCVISLCLLEVLEFDKSTEIMPISRPNLTIKFDETAKWYSPFSVIIVIVMF